jgi:two-component system sensor histidine kinase BaeS
MANELESLQKERRQMTANIAHELRTPLTNIRGYLEGIQDKVLKPNDENIDTLFNQTLHLNNLVDDLRVLSMIESGNLNLNLVEGDIVKIIEISTKDFYPRAKNSGVKINLELQNITEEKKIYFDDTRMRQIIANLIENAFSYNSENNEITIRSKISDNYYVIKIIDQGEGIPEKEVNKIFNEFYRVDKSRSKKTGGVGLGLSIVKSLIEAHNGEISVNSKINSGTTFTIKLPIIS